MKAAIEQSGATFQDTGAPRMIIKSDSKNKKRKPRKTEPA